MQCKKCSTEITTWMLFRWDNTPFRFRCSQCNTLYKINTPYMMPRIIVISLLSIILFIGMAVVGKNYGIKLLIPYLIFMFVIFFAVEYLEDKYILRKGKLEEIEKPEPQITPALFYTIAICFLVFGFLMSGLSSKLLPPIQSAWLMIFIFILFLEILLMGMVFGVKSEIKKLKDRIKE